MGLGLNVKVYLEAIEVGALVQGFELLVFLLLICLVFSKARVVETVVGPGFQFAGSQVLSS